MNTLTGRIERMGRVHRRGNWLMGCGIALAIVLLLLIGAGVFIAMNWRGWAAGGMRQGMTAAVAELPVDDAEKAETQAVVDDFLDRFEAGDISLQQLGLVMQEITESPVMPAGMAMGVSQAYFKDSGLTEEEKADGRTQIARIAHGLAGNTVTQDELRTILTPIEAAPADREVIQFQLGNRQIRLKAPSIVTDDDLRVFIAQAREQADSHDLPPTPPTFDLSGELDRAIRTALGEQVDGPVDGGVIEVPAEPQTEPEP
jgi:hypothetical protein